MDKSVADSYRWYLCVQSDINKWSCGSTTFENAMNPFFYGEKPVTKAIPIHKWTPRIFDPLILHKSIHPKMSLSM